MHEITVEAKTVAAAIEQGLREIGLRRDQVEVTVLQEASAGILGFGARPAKIVLREKLWAPEGRAAAEVETEENRGNLLPRQPEPFDSAQGKPFDSAQGKPKARGEGRRGREGNGRSGRPPRERREARPAMEAPPAPSGPWVPDVPKTRNADSEEAKAVLSELLRLLEFGECTVLAGWDEAQGRVRAEIVSPEARKLVGRDAAVLEALQFLTTLITNRRRKAQVAVQVDVEGHWKRIEERAVSSAQRGVEEVRRTGRPFRLEPMEAPLRRLVHKTLAEHPDVETQSEGEGQWRKVVLKPRKK